MKIKVQLKKMLTTFLMAVPMMVSAQTYPIEINEENFPDENFRNYLIDFPIDYWDEINHVWYEVKMGADGLITKEEIEKVSFIGVIGKNISSLKGIEYFTNLEQLRCDANQLTSLDVSKNTRLYELTCYNNQLTSLDVSKNVELEKLYCDNNQLTALDVSNNTKLTALWCMYNQLTALDVSKNTELTDLECNNNQLTSLDMSNNAALTTLSCGNNQLTSLDVSNYTTLNALGCSNNLLTTLDVSSNTVLTLLTCDNNMLTSLDVSNNTVLEWLICGDNQLTSLDVSKNTALTRLECNDNQLISLDVSNTKLTTLYCYNNQIYGNEMDDFIESLPQKDSDELYSFRIYDETESDEGNRCTKSHVAIAKSKGWTPYYCNSYSMGNKYWREYEGYDEDATTISQPTIENIDENALIYNLAGQRVESLQGKMGIYIVGGKKVLVK